MPTRYPSFGAALVAMIAAAAAAVASGAARSEPALHIVREQPLPGDLRLAKDVRWRDDSSLWLAQSTRGLYALAVDPPSTDAELVAASEGRFRSWFRLGASPTHLAGSSFAFDVWWSGPGDTGGDYAVEYPADLDVFEDRLLLIGVRRDDDGELAAEGDVAWLGRLGGELRPVLPSRSGPGAGTMQACASLGLPRARFLPDGSFVLVPGVDPGIFLFDSEGRLERTWETAALGIDAGCPLSRAQEARFGTDEEARADWRNRHRLVDEILPLPGGVGLVVRSRSAGATRWDLVRLHRDGGVEMRPLPLTSPSKWAHLSGDARGRRLALLLYEATTVDRISEPARLVLAELRDHGRVEEKP